MKLFEALTLVEEAVQEWDDQWGDVEDGWSMGLRTRFKFLTHLLIDLKNNIIEEQDPVETLSAISALCVYWIMSDYHYKPEPPQEASRAKEATGGYI